MQRIKISALKGICTRHHKRCMRKYKVSFGPRSILALILDTFCRNEHEHHVDLLDGWWEFLKQKCVPCNYSGIGVIAREFKCLDCKEYFE